MGFTSIILLVILPNPLEDEKEEMNHKTWPDLIDKEIKPVVRIIKTEIKSGKVILPEFRYMFNAFFLTPYHDTRVVIMGQDPYPSPGPPPHANGLAFSVNRGVIIPGSLRNIFTELTSDLGISCPLHGNLTKWAEQGVLLLNSSLTVEAGKSGSHKDLWAPVIRSVIHALNEKEPEVVWILWGRHAQEWQSFIKSKKIIKSVHPSPLSAERGFFGSKPFSKTNRFLVNPIDWSL